MDKETVKEGPWWVCHETPDGTIRESMGFVVSNTEHFLTLSPDLDTVGNEICIAVSAIIKDGRLKSA